MAFIVKNWQDFPSTATPTGAADFEDMETRLSNYIDSKDVATIVQFTGTKNLTTGDSPLNIYEVTGAGASTINVPTHASQPITVGSSFVFTRLGAGTVTFGTLGPTLSSPFGAVQIIPQYGQATLYKSSTTVWILGGNLG